MEIKALINHKNPDTRRIWRQGVSNKLGRLMNGINGSTGTNMMWSIYKHKMPKDKKYVSRDELPTLDYKKRKYIASG